MSSQEYKLISQVIAGLTPFNLEEIEKYIEDNPAVVNENNNMLLENSMHKLRELEKHINKTDFYNMKKLCVLLLEKGAQPSKFATIDFEGLLRHAVKEYPRSGERVVYINEYHDLAAEYIKKGLKFEVAEEGISARHHDLEVCDFLNQVIEKYNLYPAKGYGVDNEMPNRPTP